MALLLSDSGTGSYFQGKGALVTGSSSLSLESSSITRIRGIQDDDMRTIMQLFKVWKKKYPRNLLRSAFYDAKERYRDFGISIPKSIGQKVGAVVGWPQKSVRALADKSIFEGFEIPDGQDPGINDIMADNELPVDVTENIISCYKHSCSFLTIDFDPESDGTRILLTPRSADWSAALWDTNRRRIKAALTITDNDREGNITGFNVWMEGRNYACTREYAGWFADRQDNRLDRVSVVPFVYDKQMDKPFGRSRINRALMNLTDMAMRTMVRMEANAEFYSAPKLWFLGLSKDAFKKDTWSSLVSEINAVSLDEDGNKPELKQITQASMTPHAAMLETIAMLASSETDIPPENLGIRLTNPTSAEALAASENQLTRTANRQNIAFGQQLMNAMRIAIQLLDNSPTVPDLANVRPIWAPTREVSDAARADYYTKVASVSPDYADSDVGLSRLGMTFDEIRSFRTYQKLHRAQQRIDQLKEQPTQPETPASPQEQDVSGGGADELKAKFDALGVAIRAGVRPVSAARRLGLDGIEFTGLMPVSLKSPEEDSNGSQRPSDTSGEAAGISETAGQGPQGVPNQS